MQHNPKTNLNHAGLRKKLTLTTGSSLIETALVLPVLVLTLVAAADFGRAYFIGVQVASASEAGATYGLQNFTDTAGMVTAAQLNAPGVTALSVSATYGCECHDGTSVTSNCTSNPACPQNVLNYAEVTASTVYTSILPYPGIPQTLSIQNKTRMRSSQ